MTPPAGWVRISRSAPENIELLFIFSPSLTIGERRSPEGLAAPVASPSVCCLLSSACLFLPRPLHLHRLHNLPAVVVLHQRDHAQVLEVHRPVGVREGALGGGVVVEV